MSPAVADSGVAVRPQQDSAVGLYLACDHIVQASEPRTTIRFAISIIPIGKTFHIFDACTLHESLLSFKFGLKPKLKLDPETVFKPKLRLTSVSDLVKTYKHCVSQKTTLMLHTITVTYIKGFKKIVFSRYVTKKINN